MNIKRVVVVGAGAIGGCIGGLVHQSGCNVTLVARGQHGKTIQENGLIVKLPREEIRCRPECVPSIDEVKWSEGDACLIATKLNDAESALSVIHDVAGQNTPVICAFNGLQGERWAAQKFATVASLMIWMPSTHLFPGDVRVYGEDCPGVLDSGAVNGVHAEELGKAFSKILRSARFDSEFRTDIYQWKLAKLITNLGNTAQALISDDWISVAQAAQDEGESVMDQLRIERIPTRELLERCNHITLDKIDGQRRSGGSTWQSLQRGKSLESEWIEGEVVRLANGGQIDAPVNKRLSLLAEKRTQITADQFFAEL